LDKLVILHKGAAEAPVCNERMVDFHKSISLEQLELAGFTAIMAPLAPQKPQNPGFPFDYSKLF
jgi:hypothetical protein